MAKETKREFTELQQRFLDALMDPENRGDIRKAMRQAGYNDSTKTSQVIESLADEIIERSKKILASGSIRASLELLGVLDDPDSVGTKNKLEAVKQILDRAGVMKEKGDANVNIGGAQGGIVILPMKGSGNIKVVSDDDGDQE